MSNLLVWNSSMSAAQLGMAVFLTVLYSKKDVLTKEIELTRTSVDKKPASSQEYQLNWTSTNDSEKVSIGLETVSFFYVTGIFHMVYAATNNNFYNTLILRQNNFLRWIEYSISATLMIRIIAIQAGIRDSNTLSLLTTNTIGIMLQGQIVESALAGTGAMSANNKIIAITSTIIGWILMLTNFVIIGKQFANLSDDIDNLNCPDTKIPSFVMYILITQLIFYCSFGGIQLFHLAQRLRGNSVNYGTIEKAYVTFSLLSKLTLGGILAYSVVGADQGAYGTFVC